MTGRGLATNRAAGAAPRTSPTSGQGGAAQTLALESRAERADASADWGAEGQRVETSPRWGKRTPSLAVRETHGPVHLGLFLPPAYMRI